MVCVQGFTMCLMVCDVVVTILRPLLFEFLMRAEVMGLVGSIMNFPLLGGGVEVGSIVFLTLRDRILYAFLAYLYNTNYHIKTIHFV